MKHKNTFARHIWLKIASIFLVFALFCSLLYIPVYFYIRRINRSNAIEGHQSKLDTGIQTFAISINALSALDSQLFKDSKYRSVQYQNSEIDTLTISTMRSMIASYLTPYDMIAEAGLTMGSDILFVRNQLSYDLDPINWRRYFSCEKEDFVPLLKEQRCLLPMMHFYTNSYGDYDGITVAYRWSHINNMYFFATYPVNTLYRYLTDEDVLKTGCILIYAGSQLIAGTGSVPMNDYQMISSVIDNTFHLKVQVYIPNPYIDQSISGMNSLVKLFISLLGVAMVMWIAVFATATARPMSRISDVLRKSPHLEKEPGTTNELIEGIERLDSKLTVYSIQLEEQRERIRIQTLEKAIYRGLYSEESIAELYEIIPKFPPRWNMILVQYIADKPDLDDKTVQIHVVQEVRNTLSRRHVLSVSRNALLVICAPNDPDAPLEKLKDCLEKLEEEGITASYSVSPEYDDPSLLAEAFHQLEYESMVLQQRPIQQSSTVSTPISMQQLDTLYLALQCGDSDTALKALRNGVAGVRDGADFLVAQFTYRMIANMLARIRMESTCDLNDVPIPVFQYNNITHLFDEELPNCILKMTKRMNQERVDQNQSLEGEILQFIQDNITNKQLCRTFVTDHFRISAPTLQKRLSASIGKTFSDHVEDLRMQLAQKCLQENKMTIQEISDYVGYTNVNSFYKAYKRYFGKAPSTSRIDLKN